LIISGAGDYSDPWHRFGDTSLRLAEIIAGLGHQVTISDAVEKALASWTPAAARGDRIAQP
jgi:hypothetical protein